MANRRFGWHSGSVNCRDLTVDNDLTIEGDLNFGDASTDTLTVEGVLAMGSSASFTGNIDGVSIIDMEDAEGNYLKPPKMNSTQRDAMVSGWGAPEEGRMWFNTTVEQWEGWASATVIIIG